MASNLEKELEGLLTDLISDMRRKLRSKDGLTASEVKNMIELLKNNDITCEIKQGEIPDGMLEDMPDFPQSDSQVYKQ
jgi:hypothetical protein